jgi:hypothetical protein
MSLADLETALENLEGILAAATANPRPNYSVGGRTFSWGEYIASLNEDIKNTRKLILDRQGAVEFKTIALG